MRFSTLIRFLAAIVVFSLLAVTLVIGKRAFFQQDAQQAPVNKLESLVLVNEASKEALSALVAKLEVENLPDVTPGERAFESARELLKKGDFLAAEEKLKYVNTYYPTAVSAPEARRILGEMNMDRLLLGQDFTAFTSYKVKRGDSFLKIARDHKTNLDLLVLLNGLDRMDALHPGEELKILSLDFRIVIDTRKNLVSLWDGSRYIKGYEIKASTLPKGSRLRKTKVVAIEAHSNGQRVKLPSSSYHDSEKIVVLKSPQSEIRPYTGKVEEGIVGVFLDKVDMEELSLLLRAGNSVEIRY